MPHLPPMSTSSPPPLVISSYSCPPSPPLLVIHPPTPPHCVIFGNTSVALSPTPQPTISTEFHHRAPAMPREISAGQADQRPETRPFPSPDRNRSGAIAPYLNKSSSCRLPRRLMSSGRSGLSFQWFLSQTRRLSWMPAHVAPLSFPCFSLLLSAGLEVEATPTDGHGRRRMPPPTVRSGRNDALASTHHPSSSSTALTRRTRSAR